LKKVILANCRWLMLASEHSGKDWAEKVPLIDSHLDELGMDLAEETIYLIFDHSTDVCLVARPVIGPKISVHPPLLLRDWVQNTLFQLKLSGTDWDRVLEECLEGRKKLEQQGHKLNAESMILIKRRLTPGLEFSLEALFSER
jgi:hypothetical protein